MTTATIEQYAAAQETLAQLRALDTAAMRERAEKVLKLRVYESVEYHNAANLVTLLNLIEEK